MRHHKHRLMLGMMIIFLFIIHGLAAAQPAPAPLCADVGGTTNAVVRANVPGGTVPNGSAFCKVIAAEGTFVRDPSELGSIEMINLGVIQAVDVYGINLTGGFVQNFNNSVEVCLLGSGSYYYLNAAQSPRQPVLMMTTSSGGFTCATIPNAGMVVLVRGTAAAPSAAQPPAPPAPGATATPTGGQNLTPRSVIDLQCFGETIRRVRLRAEPNTTSAIITNLPWKTRLRVTEITTGWIRVVFGDGQGWVSADHFRLQAGCG
jgi:hypothetical protein